MKELKAKNVDEYITGFPKDTQVLLKLMRETIQKAAPKAEESISYNMPAYKYHGPLVYFAAFKEHIGFYATPAANEAFIKELAGYKMGKGSIQFPIDKRLPISLISKMVKYKMAQNLAKAEAKKK
ncbi:MAG: DUF1801 domain-containing protein [Saprospiraceae bacterium]